MYEFSKKTLLRLFEPRFSSSRNRETEKARYYSLKTKVIYITQKQEYAT